MFIDGIKQYDNPLNQISDIDLLSWCEKDPSSRYPLVASAIIAFKKSDEVGKYEWNPFIFAIFNKAPVLEDVLKHLTDILRPAPWNDSLVDILRRRAVLYQDLYEHENEEVVAWARNQYAKVQEGI